MLLLTKYNAELGFTVAVRAEACLSALTLGDLDQSVLTKGENVLKHRAQGRVFKIGLAFV